MPSQTVVNLRCHGGSRSDALAQRWESKGCWHSEGEPILAAAMSVA